MPPQWYVDTLKGLGPFLAEEARRRGLWAGAVEHDGRADLVMLGPADPAAVGRLRTAEHAFLYVGELRMGRSAAETAAQLRVSEVRGGLAQLRADRLRLVVRVTTEARFTRRELRTALTRHLHPMAGEDGPVELWAVQTGPRRLRVGLRTASLGAAARRRRVIERPGALRPVVAGAMLQLVEQVGLVVDPCCGTGTIAAEARAEGHDALSGDLDPVAVRAAIANGVANVARWDARRLPLPADAAAVVVTNLPFGRLHVVQGAPVGWYRKVLTEALRVAPQAVLVAAPTQPFRQALGRLDVRIAHRARIDLLGAQTAIWDLRRP